MQNCGKETSSKPDTLKIKRENSEDLSDFEISRFGAQWQLLLLMELLVEPCYQTVLY